MEFVEEVLPQDRGVQDVRVDPENDVLVLGEAPRDRRESDRLDEARTEQGRVQPVQIFRRIFQDLPLKGRPLPLILTSRKSSFQAPRPIDATLKPSARA